MIFKFAAPIPAHNNSLYTHAVGHSTK